ncbi:MAG TPA: hypothetical protein PKM13_06875, partial [Candidatus Bipolaricaulis anaerobius]|nr:hypothetical protein [Candidatus Bipolaricaulis anaerobius]
MASSAINTNSAANGGFFAFAFTGGRRMRARWAAGGAGRCDGPSASERSDMQTPWQQFRRFLRYAVPYRARITFAIACLLVIALLNAVSVGSLQPVFDALFASGGAGL